jgi:hypothetical protein
VPATEELPQNPVIGVPPPKPARVLIAPGRPTIRKIGAPIVSAAPPMPRTTFTIATRGYIAPMIEKRTMRMDSSRANPMNNAETPNVFPRAANPGTNPEKVPYGKQAPKPGNPPVAQADPR